MDPSDSLVGQEILSNQVHHHAHPHPVSQNDD